MVHFKHCIILLCLNIYIVANSAKDISKPDKVNDEIKKDGAIAIDLEKPAQLQYSESETILVKENETSPNKHSTNENGEKINSNKSSVKAETSDTEKKENTVNEKKVSHNEKHENIDEDTSAKVNLTKKEEHISKAVEEKGVVIPNGKATKENNVETSKKSESSALPQDYQEVMKRMDIDIEDSAQTGFYILMAISASALIFVSYKIYQLRQSRARRRYGSRGNTTQELAPLPTSMEDPESDEDDQTIFDRNRQQMKIF